MGICSLTRILDTEDKRSYFLVFPYKVEVFTVHELRGIDIVDWLFRLVFRCFEIYTRLFELAFRCFEIYAKTFFTVIILFEQSVNPGRLNFCLLWVIYLGPNIFVLNFLLYFG